MRRAPLVAGSVMLLVLKEAKGEAKLAAKRAEDEAEKGRQTATCTGLQQVRCVEVQRPFEARRKPTTVFTLRKGDKC